MPNIVGRDIVGAIQRSQSNQVNTYTATAPGTAVDLINNSEPVVALVVAVNAISGTTPTLDVTVEESDDGSTGWVAVPAVALIDPDTGDATTFTQVTTVDSFQVLALRRQKVTRFVRVVFTLAGTSPVYYAVSLVEGAKLSPNTGTV